MNEVKKLIRENCWSFVAYSGLQENANRGPWYKIKPGHWTYVRYLLEAYGLPAVSAMENTVEFRGGRGAQMPRHEYIRGFVAYHNNRVLPGRIDAHADAFVETRDLRRCMDLPELKHDSWVRTNMFIYIVRCPMPLGGHAYVPVEETEEYNDIEAQRLVDGPSEQNEQAMGALRRRYLHRGHVADCRTLALKSEPGAGSCDTLVLQAPQGYKCSLCGQENHHFEKACMRQMDPFRKSTGLEDYVLPFGPKKFEKIL